MDCIFRLAMSFIMLHHSRGPVKLDRETHVCSQKMRDFIHMIIWEVLKICNFAFRTWSISLRLHYWMQDHVARINRYRIRCLQRSDKLQPALFTIRFATLFSSNCLIMRYTPLNHFCLQSVTETLHRSMQWPQTWILSKVQLQRLMLKYQHYRQVVFNLQSLDTQMTANR